MLCVTNQFDNNNKFYTLGSFPACLCPDHEPLLSRPPRLPDLQHLDRGLPRTREPQTSQALWQCSCCHSLLAGGDILTLIDDNKNINMITELVTLTLTSTRKIRKPFFQLSGLERLEELSMGSNYIEVILFDQQQQNISLLTMNLLSRFSATVVSQASESCEPLTSPILLD